MLVGQEGSNHIERAIVRQSIGPTPGDLLGLDPEVFVYEYVLEFQRGDEIGVKYWEMWEEAGYLSNLQSEIMEKLSAKESMFR